jgi:hypothetical protein
MPTSEFLGLPARRHKAMIGFKAFLGDVKQKASLVQYARRAGQPEVERIRIEKFDDAMMDAEAYCLRTMEPAGLILSAMIQLDEVKESVHGGSSAEDRILTAMRKRRTPPISGPGEAGILA